MKVPELTKLSHPEGEQPDVEGSSLGGPTVLGTFDGRVHVEWDPDARAMPLGLFAYFAEFLKAGGVFSAWVDDCPLEYASPNASKVQDVLVEAVGRQTRHAGQKRLTISSAHGRFERVRCLFQRIALVLAEVRRSAEQLTDLVRWYRLLSAAVADQRDVIILHREHHRIPIWMQPMDILPRDRDRVIADVGFLDREHGPGPRQSRVFLARDKEQSVSIIKKYLDGFAVCSRPRMVYIAVKFCRRDPDRDRSAHQPSDGADSLPWAHIRPLSMCIGLKAIGRTQPR